MKTTPRFPSTESSDEAPKYVAIYRDLRVKIAAGQYAPGERLPSQQQLAEQYRVTIMTLRQALAELGAEGLVEASRGRGTFVAARPFEYRLNHLSSFAQDMRSQGKLVTTQVLGSGLIAEPELGVCVQLALSPEEKPHLLERLRLIDGRPVVYQRSYLPAAIGQSLRPKSLETESLYDLLRIQQHLVVVRAVESLRAIGLAAREATALQRRPGTPAFLSTRLSLAESDRPVLFDKAYIPGDAVEMTTNRIADSLQVSFRML